MPVVRTAANVPIPTGPTAQYLVPTTLVPSKANPQSEGYTAPSHILSLPFNQLATRVDLASAFSSGFGVINGLTVSVSSGLIVSIAAGQANIYGIAQLVAATALTLPDNTSNVYIWLKSDYSGGYGTTGVVYTTSTTPPTTTGAAGQCVLLASCVTASGAVTGPTFDTSGVVYLSKCGMPYRETSDAGMPMDTPGSGVIFLTKCPGGTFLWDGSKYQRLSDVGTYTATGSVSLTTEQTRVDTITSDNVANYTLTIPLQTRKFLVRAPAGHSIAITDGTLTVTVATGKTALVGVDTVGVYRITADV